VSVERLLDALWPDGSGSTSTLDSHLFRLRKLLEPARRRGGEGAGQMDATAGTAPDVLLSHIAEAYAQTVALSNRFAAVSHAAMGVGVGLAARRPDDAVAWAGTAAPASGPTRARPAHPLPIRWR